MNLPRRAHLAALWLALIPSLALAHHGQDFLLLESPAVPHPGNVYLLTNAQVAMESGADGQGGFEPAVLLGVSPRVSFELHAHMENANGASWAYEATAPAVHVLLTDPANHHGLKVGIGAEYEVAAHRDGRDNAEMRLSFENGDELWKWGGNLIASREQGSSVEFGGAFGIRRGIRKGVAVGAEGETSFQRAAGRELLATAYFEHDQSWALKLGLGGVRDESGHVAPVGRLGLVVRLKG